MQTQSRSEAQPRRPRRVDGHPTGTVRAANVRWFADDLEDAAGRTTGDLTLDLRGVEFMDGSGILALVRCVERLRADGRRLVLWAPADIVERALAARLPDGGVTILRS